MCSNAIFYGTRHTEVGYVTPRAVLWGGHNTADCGRALIFFLSLYFVGIIN